MDSLQNSLIPLQAPITTHDLLIARNSHAQKELRGLGKGEGRNKSVTYLGWVKEKGITRAATVVIACKVKLWL
ncbi:hypothetical protein L195_g032423 [Trifolium pratense]|uniref:Uncharacterized protein n=1 Tax=Trifolium pratense TaxID=57577 RepID=A0A2K3LDA5_TRIPR|nr:hypothetical protein L195_g032423 [Trifolium pratense]